MNLEASKRNQSQKATYHIIPFIYLFIFSGVQFITPVAPRQSLLLAKGPDQHLWKSFIYEILGEAKL